MLLCQRATSMRRARQILQRAQNRLNAVLIIALQMGAAGAAIGTVLAQGVSVVIILAWRVRHPLLMSASFSGWFRTRKGWAHILALGAPPALGLFGVAL